MRIVFTFLLIVGIARAADQPPNILPSDLQHVLNSAGSAVIYSLDPNVEPGNTGSYYHCRVLGKAQLDREETHRAAQAFADAVKDWNGVTADCFNPHHALQIKANGHIYDYLICYECLQIEVFVDGNLKVNIGAAGSPETLNVIMRAHGLHPAPAN